MPLHRDKPEEPSIDGILDAPTPINSTSRTNSIASSNITLVSYESSSPTALFTSLSQLCDWRKEPRSCIASILETRAPFKTPIRSIGQRVETWPRVSGNPTRALNYQESIRLVRSALISPDTGQEPSMARRDLVSSNQSCQDDNDEVPSAIQVHPPLAIRQKISPEQNETTSDQSFLGHLANLRGSADLLPTTPSEKEIASVYRYPTESANEPNGKEANTSDHNGHEESPNPHDESMVDVAKNYKDAPVRTLKPAGGRLRSAYSSSSPAGFDVASSHGSHTTPNADIPSYRPRLGKALSVIPRCIPHAGQKGPSLERSDLNVDVAPLNGSQVTEQLGSSTSLSHNIGTTIDTTEDHGLGFQEHSVKPDSTRSKRSSCHEL